MHSRYYIFICFCLFASLNAFSQVNDVQPQSAKEKVLSLRDQITSNPNNSPDKIQHSLDTILSLYEETYTTKSSQYADCMMWCAMICQENGDNKQALKLVRTSNKIFKQYGNGPFEGRDTIHEIFRLDLMSMIESNSERDYVASKYAQKACQLKKAYFGEQSEIYLKSLLELSKLYAARLNYSKSQEYHNLGYMSYVEIIRKEFCEKSESERINYWNSVKDYIGRTIDIAYMSSKNNSSKNKDNIASAAYNALLLSKSLLLNTTVSFENFVIASGNIKAINDLNYKKSLSSQGARPSILDSLDYCILRALDEQGQSFDIPHLRIGWKDVCQRLGPDDLAIEFFKNSGGSFGALLIKHDWEAPKIVRLNYTLSVKGKETMLERALQNDIFKSFKKSDAEDLWRLSKTIWSDAIVKHFPKTEKGNVYFSADAELLVTGIEHLPFVKPQCEGDKVVSYYSISDVFNVYRLSSTRELVTHTAATGKDAAIYGGLTYDMSPDEMLSDMEDQKRELRSANNPISYLDGTKAEAESILSIINEKDLEGLHATAYIGTKGTEASFKALSGMQQKLIHIGTHGFFYTANDTVAIQEYQLGDNPLSRSGLLFSGADNKWFGDSIPEGVDDGFLTALEISSLDFRGLDLVVLSACETGKGDINSDGVFGLQRGFKMASANSILMSLWKVDDAATSLLMTEFYKNWISQGMTKHDALEKAKQAVRSHTEIDWDDPKFWAAFILLDGLD